MDIGRDPILRNKCGRARSCLDRRMPNRRTIKLDWGSGPTHKDTRTISERTGAGGISTEGYAKQYPSHRARRSLVRLLKQGGSIGRDFLPASNTRTEGKVYLSSLILARSCAHTVLVGGGDRWVMVMATDLAGENGVPDEQRTGVSVTAKV